MKSNCFNVLLMLALILITLAGFTCVIFCLCRGKKPKENMMFIDDRSDMENPFVMRGEKLWPLSIIEQLRLENGDNREIIREHTFSDF